MQATHTEEKGQPTLLSIVIVLATLAVLTGSVWALLIAARVAPSFVASLVTGLLAIAGLVLARMYETRKKIEQDRRERLAPVYDRLMKQFYAACIAASRAGRWWRPSRNSHDS